MELLTSEEHSLALWLLVMTALVGIGAVIESKAEILELLCALVECLKTETPFDWSSLNSHSVGGLIVLIGLAGEAVVEFRQPIVEQRIRVESDKQFAALNKEAGEARKEGGLAKERASKADERISVNAKETANLRLRTEEERKNLIEAQLELADRTLADSTNLRKAMKVFPGIKVTIRYLNADEPRKLAGYLSAELYQGGWMIVGPIPGIELPWPGISINAGGDPSRGARNVLFDFLRNNCKLTRVLPAPGFLPTKDELVIEIGPKPTPRLDEIRAKSLGKPGPGNAIFFTPSKK